MAFILKCDPDGTVSQDPSLLMKLASLLTQCPGAAYICQWTGPALVQVMACHLFGAKPLPEPMLTYCQLDPWELTSAKFESKYKSFHSGKCIWTLQWLHNEPDGVLITGVSIVYSTVCSGANQRKHQSFMSLVFVRGIHWWPMNSPHKGPVTRKMVPFNDIIMKCRLARMVVLFSRGDEFTYCEPSQRLK